MEYLQFKFLDTYIICSGDSDFLTRLYCYWKDCKLVSFVNSFPEHSFWHVCFSMQKPFLKTKYLIGETYFYNITKSPSMVQINSLIRELITKLSLSAGVIWLHASCVSINGHGVVFLGRKGAGKTTLAMYVAMNGYGLFISNDQVPVFLIDDDIYTIGWRPDLKFTPDTAKLLQYISHETPKECDKYYNHIGGNTDIDLDELSKRSNQRLKLFNLLSMPFCNMGQPVKIESFIVLSSQINGSLGLLDYGKNTIWNKIFLDKENLLPSFLPNWNNIIPFWNTRVCIDQVSDCSIELENRISQCIRKKNMYVISSRMQEKEIEKFLCRR